jgi:hypothetical protein
VSRSESRMHRKRGFRDSYARPDCVFLSRGGWAGRGERVWREAKLTRNSFDGLASLWPVTYVARGFYTTVHTAED